jgi:hypothetical protein
MDRTSPAALDAPPIRRLPVSTPLAGCPQCDPDNPAARYRDTCLIHRVKDGLPAHYFDCDRVQRDVVCDCTATADIEALLTERQSPLTAPKPEEGDHV